MEDMMKSLSKRFGPIVLGLAIFWSWSLQADAKYIMKDLGVMPGGTYSVATAINNSGQIVGYGDTLVGTTLRTRAFLYTNGVMIDLGTVAGWTWSKAYAVNDAGQIVGEGGPDPEGYWRYPFLYSGGVMTQLAPPPALNDPSRAYGINNSGQIVGYGSHIGGTGNNHAFLYEGSAVLDLGTLGGSYSCAYAINNLGRIVGYASAVSTDTNAVLYDGINIINLGNLGGNQDGWKSCAYAINDVGQIVGGSIITGNLYQHAFLYENNVMQDLGANGQNESCAKGINKAGQIVGWYGGGAFGRGFVYSNGKMQDVGDLASNPGSFHTFANGINDSGWIVGQSRTKPPSADHAFLATPIVLPSVSLLLLE